MPPVTHCGLMVNGYPCMRVPGHPGLCIPGIAELETPFNEGPFNEWFNSKRYTRWQLYWVPITVGVLCTAILGIQAYIDFLVLIHWGV